MARFPVVRLSDSLLCTSRHSLNNESTGKIWSLTFQMVGRLGLLLLLTACPLIAQNPPNPNAGILMWSTNDFGINLATSGINIDIPMRSKAGAIPFSSRLFGTSQAYVANYTTGGEQGFYTNGGIGGYSDPTSVTLNSTFTIGTCPQQPYEAETTIKLASITDQTGATHSLGNASWIFSDYCPRTPAPIVIYDGSGYTFVATTLSGTSGTFSIYDRSGNHWDGTCDDACQVSGTLTDPDGNRITDAIGGTPPVTDTLGTQVLNYEGTSSLYSYSYADQSGNTQYYNLNLSTTVNFKTNFACPNTNESYGSNFAETSLSVPGGGQYSFAYEPTPNGNGFTNTNPPTYFTGPCPIPALRRSPPPVGQAALPPRTMLRTARRALVTLAAEW